MRRCDGAEPASWLPVRRCDGARGGIWPKPPWRRCGDASGDAGAVRDVGGADGTRLETVGDEHAVRLVRAESTLAV